MYQTVVEAARKTFEKKKILLSPLQQEKLFFLIR